MFNNGSSWLLMFNHVFYGGQFVLNKQIAAECFWPDASDDHSWDVITSRLDGLTPTLFIILFIYIYTVTVHLLHSNRSQD